MFLPVYCIIIFAIHLAAAGSEIFSMTLHQSGFHRTLRYVLMSSSKNYNKCAYFVAQTLPAGMYVDTDQLNEMKSFGKIDSIVNERINVEAISSKSDPFLVHLYSQGTPNFIIELPVHFRYNLPSNQSYSKIKIEYPNLLRCCVASDPLVGQTKCIKTLDANNWKSVDYEAHTDNISVNIPNGYLEFRILVKIVTIAISWAACGTLVATIRHKSNGLRFGTINKQPNRHAQTSFN